MEDKARLLVKQFADALSLAIFDSELPQLDIPVIFYYDTDVILHTIMGLEAEGTSSSSELLIRALLSCGLLGEFYLLRPHAFELNEKLRQKGLSSRRMEDQVFLAKAQQFLRTTPIEGRMRDLQRIIEEEDAPSLDNAPSKLERFVNTLRQMSGETFAQIEQCRGTWQNRLRGYLDSNLIRFDKLGPETSELIEKHEEIVYEIYEILRSRRADYPLNTFQDAVALTILHSLVEDRDQELKGDVVRFYTRTGSIRSTILENERLRALLSYQAPLVHDSPAVPGAELVLRDSSYLILRAWFPELAQDRNSHAETLASLKDLAKNLDEILRAPGKGIRQALQETRHEGKSLGDLVQDFQNLTIMDSVWTTERIPNDLKKLQALKQWTVVFEFAEKPAANQLVREQIADVQNDLGSTVIQMGTWKEYYTQVRRAAQRIYQKFHEELRHPLLDLGLVPWACMLLPDNREDLLKTVHSLLQENDTQRDTAAVRLAARMTNVQHDSQQYLVICGILWALGLTARIVTLVDEWMKAHPQEQVAPGLCVIQAAARVKLSNPSGHEERRQAIAQVCALLNDLPQEQRSEILLGASYVLHRAWKREKLASSISGRASQGVEKEIAKWAQKSFDLGEQACRVLASDETARAYSIYHCAYVAITAGINLEKTAHYLERLVELRSFSTQWSSRFLGAAGAYCLFRAERAWEKSSRESRAELDLSLDIQSGRSYLQEAKFFDTGDMDVDEYLNRLNLLEDRYKRLQQD